MGLFGRKAKGRHALGAAVTSIPSGPPPVAVAVAAPVYEPPVAPAAPAYEAPVAPAAPAYEAPVLARQTVPATTAEAVSQLLVTGEWAASAEDEPSDPAAGFAVPLLPPAVPEQHQPPTNLQPFPVPPPSPLAPPSAAPVPAVPAAVLAPLPTPEPPTPGPAPQAAAAPSPAPRAAPARSSLEAALAELLPSQEVDAAETPGPTAPSRVQLGFRDGTSAPLDPQSTQFAELEALAQSLTQRD